MALWKKLLLGAAGVFLSLRLFTSRSTGGAVEEGIASFYGEPFHGRPTASGETFNMNDMTAAHKTLPFGTVVDVFDLDTGNRVRVRINDRGPFVAGRILDLSQGAARALGTLTKGTARVRLTVLALGDGKRVRVS